jgi:hypothetical protein
VHKSLNIKNTVYKVIFASVLCAFFFVQTQAAFIACTNSDYGANGQSNFFQKSHTGLSTTQANTGGNNLAKVKLNKRYQPVNFSAILPLYPQAPSFFPVISTNWVSHSFLILPRFLYCKPLRGPPSL